MSGIRKVTKDTRCDLQRDLSRELQNGLQSLAIGEDSETKPAVVQIRCGNCQCMQLNSFCKILSSDIQCCTPNDIQILLANTSIHMHNEQNPQASFASGEKCLQDNCRQLGLKYAQKPPADINGDSLFFAASNQLRILGEPERSPSQLRGDAVEYLRSHQCVQGRNCVINFKDYIPPRGGMEDYCKEMARGNTPADAIILYVLAHILQRNIKVVTSSPQGSQDQGYFWVIASEDYVERRPLILGNILDHYQSLEIDYDFSFGSTTVLLAADPGFPSDCDELSEFPSMSTEGLLQLAAKPKITFSSQSHHESSSSSGLSSPQFKELPPANPRLPPANRGQLPANPGLPPANRGQPPANPGLPQSSAVPLQNDLKLCIKYRTHNKVLLSWKTDSNKYNLLERPYTLWYQEDGVRPLRIPLCENDNFFTKVSLELPAANYKENVVLAPGKSYKFILKAGLEDSRVLWGIANVKMPEKPCHDALHDIAESPEMMQRLCILIDPKRHLYRALGQKFGLSIEEIEFIEARADPYNHPVTSQLFQNIVKVSRRDDDRMKVCNILEVIHCSGFRKPLEELFWWHTGRDDGPGACMVCTRDQFLT